MDKNNLVSQLSISCVENYFLAWCSEIGIDRNICFSSSFISASDVLADFISNGAVYESYEKIERVQTVAEKLGLVKKTFVKEIKNNEEGKLNLIKVNEQFFKNFKRLPLRKDHYIVKLSERDFLSNYPLKEFKLTATEQNSIFDGTLIFEKVDKISEENILNSLKQELFKIANCVSNKNIISGDVYAIRNAIGILKISRKRVNNFLFLAESKGLIKRDKELNSFFEKLINDYERLFLLSEISLVRGRMNENIIFEELNNIFNKERELAPIIIARLK